VTSREHLARFVVSRRNIAGALLGLVGVGLFVAGVTSGVVGLAVVVGLYVIGYLVVSRERAVSAPIAPSQDVDAIEDGLRRLLIKVRFQVADDIYDEAANIVRSIIEILPNNATTFDTIDPNLNIIRQTALNYLPHALDAYLALPRSYAESQPTTNGKTAHDSLLDQLKLMDAKLREIGADIARNDTDRVLANGLFLQERFADSSLDAVGGTRAVTDGGGGPTSPQPS
jgi:hypothetical protein